MEVLPAHDWIHCLLCTAVTTLASKIEEPQTYKSRPVTDSQVVFSTVWYTLSGTLMQLGHVHTGSKQSVVLVSRRLRLACGAGEVLVPKMLFRFKRRSCSDFAKMLPRSVDTSRGDVLAAAGTMKSPATKNAAHIRGPAELSELCMPRARRMVPEGSDA